MAEQSVLGVYGSMAGAEEAVRVLDRAGFRQTEIIYHRSKPNTEQSVTDAMEEDCIGGRSLHLREPTPGCVLGRSARAKGLAHQ
jgi:hypothetical protein